MSDDSKMTGHCLCGAVKITVTGEHKDAGVCHCGMCRRWSGGPAMALDVGQDIEIEGRENVTAYRSSDWAERGFCKTCGSNLYYRIVEADSYVIYAGILDGQDSLTLKSQIFIDEKPAFYDFANQTQNMTGAEVFALYAPPADPN
ncbi:GFA family protein [Pelagibius litoralis]|uniref:GFA family protein n=1 Tax=Pelagibius litoralis TaxID=374515 RepID=A0A967F149_9PROT|nr:GFA family protein [Pelagibius litoralis]NIA71104.1 GFA family protein [Pelagibius litoralis]